VDLLLGFILTSSKLICILQVHLISSTLTVPVLQQDDSKTTPSTFAQSFSHPGPGCTIGHCCESGDLFSCAPGEPEVLAERELGATEIGDLVAIDGAGAYCAGMSTKNYNSFPEAPEVLLTSDGEPRVIRRRQTLEQILENEV
jgi:hypothetical protein